MRELYVIAHNLRSAHNVGSLFRTAEGLGVKKIFLCGITAYPRAKDDNRLPHLIEKLSARINKTALGACELIDWEYRPDVFKLMVELKQEGIKVVALEQTRDAKALNTYEPAAKIALILGNEIGGVSSDILNETDEKLFIPMFGKKESFNVVQAAAMALYELRFR